MCFGVFPLLHKLMPNLNITSFIEKQEAVTQKDSGKFMVLAELG